MTIKLEMMGKHNFGIGFLNNFEVKIPKASGDFADATLFSMLDGFRIVETGEEYKPGEELEIEGGKAIAVIDPDKRKYLAWEANQPFVRQSSISLPCNYNIGHRIIDIFSFSEP